jgi:hypothetical protein
MKRRRTLYTLARFPGLLVYSSSRKQRSKSPLAPLFQRGGFKEVVSKGRGNLNSCYLNVTTIHQPKPSPRRKPGSSDAEDWIPASAGMTVDVEGSYDRNTITDQDSVLRHSLQPVVKRSRYKLDWDPEGATSGVYRHYGRPFQGRVDIINRRSFPWVETHGYS